ncbi:hypothetical protein PQO03_17125 [Lentisphaera profundi]|uniref:Uncharacterized protein n=1 Tax=Lentisphaera profundi TaxID=1658616 RepID=A0ABY7VTK8_9BACT|nr:hypothetical protein [Lentisphaera profundi]WDE97551.1 hypothetical protein PQO03_17125 [Lentisphaera profundi]
MKFFSNSIFLLSVLTYILVGTVPIWKCLKVNELHISMSCTEDKEVDSCCSKKVSSKHQLEDVCCEEIEQVTPSLIIHSLDPNCDLEQSQSLAYLIFDDHSNLAKSTEILHYSNATPPSQKTSLFKLHCTYLC